MPIANVSDGTIREILWLHRNNISPPEIAEPLDLKESARYLITAKASKNRI